MAQDYGYKSGSLGYGEVFILVSYGEVEVIGGEWQMAGYGPVELQDWHINESAKSVYDYNPGLTTEGRMLAGDGGTISEIVYYNSSYGYWCKGWVINGNFGILTDHALGGSDQWGTYEYRFTTRRDLGIYEKDGTFIEALPAGSNIWCHKNAGAGSNQHYLNIRHFQRNATGTIYRMPYTANPDDTNRWGWINLRPDLGTWLSAFSLQHKLN